MMLIALSTVSMHPFVVLIIRNELFVPLCLYVYTGPFEWDVSASVDSSPNSQYHESMDPYTVCDVSKKEVGLFIQTPEKRNPVTSPGYTLTKEVAESDQGCPWLIYNLTLYKPVSEKLWLTLEFVEDEMMAPELLMSCQLYDFIKGLLDKLAIVMALVFLQSIYSGSKLAAAIEHSVMLICTSFRWIAITAPFRISCTQTVTTYTPEAGARPVISPVVELTCTLFPNGLEPLKPCPYGTEG